MLEIIITANSPGEVAAWVKPAVQELKDFYPESKIYVFLPPCIFASGSEKKVLEKFTEINQVYDQREYLKYMTLGINPGGFSPGSEGIVIFLGGDLFHAVLLGKRLNYPVIAYTEGVYSWKNQIKNFLVPDQRTKDKLLKSGAPAERIRIIGNLMLDAVVPELTPGKLSSLLESNGEKQFIITLFPGSRPAEVEFMLPFLLELAGGLSQSVDRSNFKFLLSQSPFVSDEQIAAAVQKHKGIYLDTGSQKKIRLGDLEIAVFSKLQYSLMQITDLALTIPGTNNLELAFFGTPMVVFLPLNWPEKIPLEGLAGLMGKIPLLGPALMKYLVPKTASRLEFVALINVIARERIVPEIRGVLKPADLPPRIMKIIEDKAGLEEMSRNLKEAAGSKGAARELVRIVDEVLHSSP